MANDSLYDLSSFLNRWFWRIELPLKKSASLHILHAVRCCLYVFPQVRLNGRVRLRPLIGSNKKFGEPSWVILSTCASAACDQDPRPMLTGEVVFPLKPIHIQYYEFFYSIINKLKNAVIRNIVPARNRVMCIADI